MESPFECGMVVKGVCLSTSDTVDHLGFSYTVSQSQFSGENNTRRMDRLLIGRLQQLK